MFDFWLDTNSFVTPYRGAYRFETVPKFWEFLEDKSKDQIIVSSEMVLQELEKGKQGQEKPDSLLLWAAKQDKLFLPLSSEVQEAYKTIADSVKNNKQYKMYHVHEFLDEADPWVIAHAKAFGGRVVTFEKNETNSTKPKIPDVADKFDIKCICIWDMLSELHAVF